MLAARFKDPCDSGNQGAFEHLVVKGWLCFGCVLGPQVGACESVDVGGLDCVGAVLEVGADWVVGVFLSDFDDTVDGNFLGDLESHLRELEVEALDAFEDLFFLLDLLGKDVVAVLLLGGSEQLDQLIGLNLLQFFASRLKLSSIEGLSYSSDVEFWLRRWSWWPPAKVLCPVPEGSSGDLLPTRGCDLLKSFPGRGVCLHQADCLI